MKKIFKAINSDVVEKQWISPGKKVPEWWHESAADALKDYEATKPTPTKEKKPVEKPENENPKKKKKFLPFGR